MNWYVHIQGKCRVGGTEAKYPGIYPAFSRDIAYTGTHTIGQIASLSATFHKYTIGWTRERIHAVDTFPFVKSLRHNIIMGPFISDVFKI
jgi:hypothetical protein